jgi:hypothetical protein
MTLLSENTDRKLKAGTVNIAEATVTRQPPVNTLPLQRSLAPFQDNGSKQQL